MEENNIAQRDTESNILDTIEKLKKSLEIFNEQGKILLDDLEKERKQMSYGIKLRYPSFSEFPSLLEWWKEKMKKRDPIEDIKLQEAHAKFLEDLEEEGNN